MKIFLSFLIIIVNKYVLKKPYLHQLINKNHLFIYKILITLI